MNEEVERIKKVIEENKYRNTFHIVIGLITLYLSRGGRYEFVINEIRNMKKKNDLYFDLGLYLNYLTEEDLGGLTI